MVQRHGWIAFMTLIPIPTTPYFFQLQYILKELGADVYFSYFLPSGAFDASLDVCLLMIRKMNQLRMSHIDSSSCFRTF